MTLKHVLAELSDETFRAVTIPTLMVFNAVGESDPIHVLQSDLNSKFGLENVSLSCLAKQARLLSSLGLIERSKDPHDARQYLLSMTDKGLSLWRELQ